MQDTHFQSTLVSSTAARPPAPAKSIRPIDKIFAERVVVIAHPGKLSNLELQEAYSEYFNDV